MYPFKQTHLCKKDKLRIAELWEEGFSVTELALMYHVSVFRILGCLEKFGVKIYE